jgi:hypothetical protein
MIVFHPTKTKENVSNWMRFGFGDENNPKSKPKILNHNAKTLILSTKSEKRNSVEGAFFHMKSNILFGK